MLSNIWHPSISYILYYDLAMAKERSNCKPVYDNKCNTQLRRFLLSFFILSEIDFRENKNIIRHTKNIHSMILKHIQTFIGDYGSYFLSPGDGFELLTTPFFPREAEVYGNIKEYSAFSKDAAIVSIIACLIATGIIVFFAGMWALIPIGVEVIYLIAVIGYFISYRKRWEK